ncbi:BnaC04g03230D [Brassica napus]|uniref:BnaC04g03230D protein n=1 Tax=Brassica napus TaxID=3708 RepID=A0A078FY01_BRANA|nr:BnaC04g03230D [Brassica napus]
MADQQTLDSDDLSHSTSSDPSLLRSLSSSRLNAGAPEFPHHHPHRFHHSRHQQNQHYVPARSHQQEPDSVVKKSERRDHHKRESKSDQTTEAGASSVVIDPKTGLPEDTIQKIVNQVEYYFSDLNLATTDHLMRFISKDPEGYVPIQVVASFKKVKAVVSGNSQLATVLQNSAKLVVSEDGKKVRRMNPVTETALEELQSRIVIAENLPEDHCYQNLMKIFSTVGSVKNIRTCQPQITGNAVPPAARSAKSDGTLFSNKVHAFVEYETVELAEKAVAELNEAGNWRSSLKVRLMLKPQTKEPKQGQGRGRKGHDVEVEHEEDEATASEQQQQPIEKLSEECSGEWDTHVPEQAVIVGEEQGNEKAAGQRKGRSRGRGKGRGRGQPHQNQNQNHNGRGNHHNHHHQHQVGTPPSNNQMNSMEQQPKQQPPGPRMPDGTRGFSMGRGKPVTVQAD